jgi:hypothetical protein
MDLSTAFVASVLASLFLAGAGLIAGMIVLERPTAAETGRPLPLQRAPQPRQRRSSCRRSRRKPRRRRKPTIGADRRLASNM